MNNQYLTNESAKNIYNDISYGILFEYNGIIMTEDLMYLCDDMVKLYYSDIYSISMKLGFSKSGRFKFLVRRYNIITKDNKNYYFEVSWKDNADSKIKSLLNNKNSSIKWNK